jgi:hypothetical protein
MEDSASLGGRTLASRSEVDRSANQLLANAYRRLCVPEAILPPPAHSVQAAPLPSRIPGPMQEAHA